MASSPNIRVWRICNAKWAATAFNGTGAKLYGGRWNPIGVSVIYTSSSLALATLELLVHLGVKASPQAYVAIAADIPGGIAKEQVDKSSLPTDWRTDPPPSLLATIGEEWVSRGNSAVLQVPSAVIDEEWNYWLNPQHPDFAQIAIAAAKEFQFDSRLFN